MKNVKKIFDRLWIIFVVVGVASAADVAPLVFDSLTTYYKNLSNVGDPATMDASLKVDHQNYWNKLMTFKMWGTSGITMGHASTRDVNGAIGTAHGDMELTNGDHNLGGPIYIGGDIIFNDGPDSFLSGPVRVMGDFATGANGNSFYGTHCIEGTASTKNQNISFGDEFKNDKEPVGRYATGGAAKVGMCSYDSVPAVPTYLTIPDVPALPANANVVYGDFSVPGGKTYAIDIPREASSSNMYDLYIGGSIVLGDNAKLHIRMLSSSNLARIFMNGSLQVSSGSQIQVVYVDSNATYVPDPSTGLGQWTEITDSVAVKNEDYAGNVLFHCKDDISWPSMNGTEAFFQGSFMSEKKIHVESNLVLAGQLLANELEIGHEFNGNSFRYVPFDPPVVDLSTADGIKTHIVEGHDLDTVKISLDKAATTLIDFEYCFVFDGTEVGKDPNSEAMLGDIATSIPLFNKTTQKCDNPLKGYFDVDSKNLRTPIVLTAEIDGIEEGSEHFRIRIENLNAATLKDGSHEGFIDLYIDDPEIIELTFEKDTLRAIDENPAPNAVIDTLRGIHGPKGCDDCEYSLSDTSHYSDFVSVDEKGVVRVKDSTKFDFEKIQYIDIQVHVVDAANHMEADTTIIIPIGNVNENPILKRDEFDVDEHKPAKTTVGTIDGDDIDKVDSLKNNVFEVIGGAKELFDVDSKTGVITTKKELDYETMDTTYILVVKLRDYKDESLYAIDTMTIHVHNVNESPKITTDTLYVTENSKKGTDVGEIKAIDPDKNDTQTFTLVNDPSGCFEVAPDGSVTVSEKCEDIDREKNPVIVIEVRVTDAFGATDVHKVSVVVKDIPSPKIEVTDTTWTKPKEPIYTNDDNYRYCWIINSQKDDDNCADTILKPGKNIVRKEVCNVEGFEGCAVDSLVVFYSNAAPVVTVTVNPDAKKAANIYTIVEQTEVSDTNIYVNRTKNDILVTVKDSASRKDTSFTVKLDLDTLSASKKTYEPLVSVAKETVALDEGAKNKVKTPVNGSEVKVSYPAKVAGVDVTVSYTIDNDGEIVKQKVVNDKGQEELIEVITVSYETVINGKTVSVSYIADATTGAKLVKDASGQLMTKAAAENEKSQVGSYAVTYEYKDATGNTVVVSYTVDEKGALVKNAEGNIGYEVSYTYVNQYGNSATQSVFIVLDRIGPKVEILSPTKGQVIRSNFVNVTWTVDGMEQDSLTLQGLEKGPNVIVRFYRDKAGNEASDTIMVIMKDSKDVDIAVEQPVTEISKEKVEKFYEKNPPKPGQTFAVSIRNPATEREVETLIGGSFKTREGSGEEPYPGETSHLGPTLAMDVRLPVVNGVGGLATLDDLLSSDGMVPLEGVDADGGSKLTVENYVREYCEEGVNVSDLNRVNLYRTKLMVKIWVYTTLGNFVDYFSFSQDLNDPDYTNDAGMLQMFFELKPDKDGFVKADNGKMIGTGAYLYKVDATIRSQLRCTLPPVKDESGKKKGDVVRSSESLLKPFGYKRPIAK